MENDAMTGHGANGVTADGAIAGDAPGSGPERGPAVRSLAAELQAWGEAASQLAAAAGLVQVRASVEAVRARGGAGVARVAVIGERRRGVTRLVTVLRAGLADHPGLSTRDRPMLREVTADGSGELPGGVLDAQAAIIVIAARPAVVIAARPAPDPRRPELPAPPPAVPAVPPLPAVPAPNGAASTNPAPVQGGSAGRNAALSRNSAPSRIPASATTTTAIVVDTTVDTAVGTGVDIAVDAGGVAPGEVVSVSEAAILAATAGVAHIADVLVAITRTDLVDADRAAQVRSYVEGRVAAVGPAIRVVSTPGSEPAVLHWLVGVATRPDRARRHEVQVARQLSDLVGSMLPVLRSRAADAQRREDAVTTANRAAMTERLLAFDELRAEMLARQGLAADEFRRHLAGISAKLTADLDTQLRQTTDPARWWRQELPVQLRQRLEHAARGFGFSMVRAVHRDMSWLRARLRGLLGIDLDAPSTLAEAMSVTADPPVSAASPGFALPRLVYRAGPAILAFAGALLVPGIGPGLAVLSAIAGGFIGEVLLRGAVDEQRRRLTGRIDLVVHRAVRDFGTQVSDRLKRRYDSELDAMLRLRREHGEGRLTLPARVSPGETDWAALVERATTLTAEIAATLETVWGKETS